MSVEARAAVRVDSAHSKLPRDFRSEADTCFCCGKVAITRDHVPPKCMFPKPWPNNLITVPACRDCNDGTKLDDEYFRLVIASATSGSEPAAKLLKDKIFAKARTRPALLNSHIRSMLLAQVHLASGLFVGIRPAFRFDRMRMQYVINKIIRGLFYHETRCRLSPDAKIDDFLLNPPLDRVNRTLICTFPLRDIGDGTVFSYRFALSDEQPEDGLWYLMFYGRVLFVIGTEPVSAENAAGVV